MVGVTGDSKTGAVVIGYQKQNSVNLQNSTDRGALYAVLNSTFK